jgi:hypothetical protein
LISVQKIYPDIDGNSFYAPCDYRPLIDSFGFTTLVEVHDNDYQGDSRYLLKDLITGHIGYLQFGWGSCSGCDSLQACSTWEDIQELRESLYLSILWGTPEDMLEYFKTHDWAGDYSWYKEEQQEFVSKAIEMLERGDLVVLI